VNVGTTVTVTSPTGAQSGYYGMLPEGLGFYFTPDALPYDQQITVTVKASGIKAESPDGRGMGDTVCIPTRVVPRHSGQALGRGALQAVLTL